MKMLNWLVTCVCVAFTHENVKLAGNVCVWLLLMKMLNWLVTCVCVAFTHENVKLAGNVCVCGFYS